MNKIKKRTVDMEIESIPKSAEFFQLLFRIENGTWFGSCILHRSRIGAENDMKYCKNVGVEYMIARLVLPSWPPERPDFMRVPAHNE